LTFPPHGRHDPLPSFPTRRSPDLAADTFRRPHSVPRAVPQSAERNFRLRAEVPRPYPELELRSALTVPEEADRARRRGGLTALRAECWLLATIVVERPTPPAPVREHPAGPARARHC